MPLYLVNRKNSNKGSILWMLRLFKKNAPARLLIQGIALKEQLSRGEIIVAPDLQVG
jgi:hypothetical protein